ncbi:MAG: type II secretion system F family protein [Deltaproteobacteria bacterium]|jgi:type II secretory pathway component PulF|nr:type II secretion system F family protein [Deltaproteobacteria bacterium]
MRHFIIKSYFGQKTRAKTWTKLATLLRYNVGELKAAEMLHDRYAARRHILANLFAAVIDDLNKGHPLDVALLPWAPPEEIMLIRGGQKSARLPEALLDCVALIEARQKITGSLISAVSYPLLLGVMFIVLLLVVSMYVIPELAQISNPDTWSGAAAALYAAGSFVSSFAGAAVLLMLVALSALALLSLPYWTGPVRAAFDRLPPWSIYRLILGSIWMFSVATLLRANIQLDQILGDMLDSDVLRPWLRERVALIKERYQYEANLGTVLLQLDLNFPDQELVEELAVYASFPDFHKNLFSIAKDWLGEGVERINSQAKALNTIFIIGIMLVLCAIGLAIGSMQQQFMGGF